MHRRTAVFALLQYIMAIFACDLKSEISRSQRSIIEVPTFFDDRFAQEQRHSVVGYDGQCRQMFEEAVDDGRCYSLNSRANFQLPAQPEKPRNIIYLHSAYSSIVTIVIIYYRTNNKIYYCKNKVMLISYGLVQYQNNIIFS